MHPYLDGWGGEPGKFLNGNRFKDFFKEEF